MLLYIQYRILVKADVRLKNHFHNDKIKKRKLLIGNILNVIIYIIREKQIVICKINKVKIIVPPIDLQNQFADFVQHIDKLEFELKKSLEEMQNLFDSLMTEYFE